MKKIFKIIGIIVGILLILLLAAPYLFKDSLEKLLVKNINENLNATVAWEVFDLSLFSSFPNAALVINNYSVINKVPFEGDTLVSGQQLKLNMGITQLLNGGGDPIKLDEIILNKAKLNIKVDVNGNANYDIAIKEDTPGTIENTEEAGNGFTFDLQHYELNDSEVIYTDESTKTCLTLSEFNHEGTGDFSMDTMQLDTQTSTIVSYKMEGEEYLNKTAIVLDAVFQMDLFNQKYSFLKNEARINDLPLTFDGFVQMNETNNEIDLTFKTPSSDFKNFLALIPKAYVKDMDGVSTTGNFSVNGTLKGIADEERIPTMDIKVRSENASFKYPDLPKEVRNISINVDLVNTTGFMKDTYLNIGGITFKIDNEIFNVSGNVKDFTENMLINLALQGTLNLANINKVLPIEMEQNLTGVFKADVVTNFDMQSVEKEQYQNIKTTGTASLNGFNYSDAAFKNPIAISNASIKMSPGNIILEDMNATTGDTDVNASGTIQNLIPWIMAKQDLKGRFLLKSDTFNLNDFMSETSESATGNEKTSLSTAEDKIKIPDFLDATIDFQAKKVIYDDLTLDNAKGSVVIKNETAGLRNITSSLLGGDIALDGNISTKTETPTFAMDLDLSKINIDESFAKLGILKFLVPIAKGLQGNMNTKIKLNGNLNSDLTPDLKSLAGNAFAQILTAEVNKEQIPLLNALGSELSFLNLDQLSVQDVATNLKFDNGNIVVSPFDFDVQGIKITAGGSHGFDQNMNYNIKMDVPAKYLGSEVTSLLAKLDPAEVDKMTVALPIGLTGSFDNTKVNLNTNAAISELTKKLIDKQKDDLINQGANAIQDLIGGGNSNENNGTTNSASDALSGILDGIIKPKDSTTPSTTNQNGTNTNSTTETIKDVFGGLFGGGKKKKKDSIKGGN
jgi:hypothetical protein